MRKSLLPIIILLTVTIISCGKKKKKVIASGVIEENGYVYATWEEFINNDSAFVVFTDAASGKINKIHKAENEPALRDSTYTAEYFFPSGKLMMIQKYKQKKRDGSWPSFFENGKMAGETVFKNGIVQHYTLWFENGKVQTKGELLPDSTFRHREYFENGSPKKEMAADKNGKGQATYYYANGKIHETGPIVNFNRTGIWKIYDTLGNVKQDTLFGIK